MKIGVFTPTFNRPDYARSVALQMANQDVQPNVLAIHQNGNLESYQWSIDDIRTSFSIRWIHTPKNIPQDQWYLDPLKYLLAEEITHFFWCDHDDIYLRDHIRRGIDSLSRGNDFSINSHCGLLKLGKSRFEYNPSFRFTAHAPGGMSSSMCFNREFAEALVDDLGTNFGKHAYSDQVVSFVTKPKFRSSIVDSSASPSTVYVSHPGSLTSSSWLAEGIPTIESITKPLVWTEANEFETGTKILAHIAHIGDVCSKDWPAISVRQGHKFAIQGIQIDSIAEGLEYKVRLQDGCWTPWVPNGKFIGTRGRGIDITGVAVRLVGRLVEVCSLQVLVVFSDDSAIRVFEDSRACLSSRDGSVVVAIQILLRPR